MSCLATANTLFQRFSGRVRDDLPQYEYYKGNMPFREIMMRRIAVFLAVACCGAASAAGIESAPTQKIEDSMNERLQACVSCHGQQGRGIDKAYFPRLAGKPAGYLYNQLVAFRNGSRKYAPMNYLLAYLPDPYLQKMAEYFAAQDVPAPVSTSPALPESAQLLAMGDEIVHRGVGTKTVPACVSCHGADLGGRSPGIPGLLGLRADYISAQLGAWRYGTRTAIAPDCMQYVASSLTEPQVAAVSAWLAAQPVTPGVRPASAAGPVASRMHLPMACGSQP